MLPMIRHASSSAFLVLALGCAQHGAPAASPPPQAPGVIGAPLADLAAAHVVLLPVQRLRPADSLGWSASTDARDFLAALDEQIAATLRTRGVAAGWALPADLVRSARRNPGVAVEPYGLTIAPLLQSRRAGGELHDPLASQLRTMVALHDARYALVPLELRFEPAGGGMERAVLRVDLLDARLSQVRWTGEVSSDAEPALTSALAATLAARFVDLIAAR
jgi:hypothetical protein